MKGFTVKCNECGKEMQVVEPNNHLDPVNIYSDYDGFIYMKCECGNKISR